MARPTTTYRRFLYGFTVAAVVLSACIYCFNFIVDPLQYYRVPTIRTPRYFSSYERYQNVGLARTRTYDTVVIGSSLAENFLPSHMSRIWNVRPVKLSISGSTPHEQRLILDQALATAQVRKVLWVLDYGGFTTSATAVRDESVPFPYYMYRGSVFNVEYPLSLDTLRLSLAVQFHGNGEADIDKLDSWYDRFQFGKEIVLKQWSGNCNMFQRKYEPDKQSLTEHVMTTMQHSLKVNVLNAVKNNPDVTFYLVLPPYSTLFYVPADSGILEGSIIFRRMLVDRLSSAANVRLFDFGDDRHVTDDLNNYKDLIHYDIQINDLMLKAISADEYRLRSDNLDEHIAHLIAQVNEYDLCRDGQNLTASRSSN
jgi:hypothetical protein